jgi:hypothetical protein
MIFTILLAGAALGIILYRSILVCLRDRHPEVWESLGHPSFPFGNSIATNVRVRRFLASAECRALQDPVLERRVRFQKLFEFLYLVLLVVALVLAISE